MHTAHSSVHNVHTMTQGTALTARIRDRSRRRVRAGQPVTGRQAVHRVLTVLSLFHEGRRELSVVEVATELDVHRSTAFRLLAELQNYGLVDYDERERCYRPGLGLVSLAGLTLTRFPGRALARRALFGLRDETGESTHLSVLDHSDVVYLEQASTIHATVDTDWVGLRQPAYASTSGRLLLAYADPAGPGTGADPPAGPADPGDRPSPTELADTRERGYLVRETPDGSGDEAMAGVAAAVCHPRSSLVYALAVGGPVRRVSTRRLHQELVPAVLRAASQVSEHLGESPW